MVYLHCLTEILSGRVGFLEGLFANQLVLRANQKVLFANQLGLRANQLGLGAK
jgi:hypothetical protein